MRELLLTGFEPFDSSDINPSAEVVKAFERAGVEGFRLHTLVLPVDATRAPGMLEQALVDLRPAWCLMLGEARGRAALSVERLAVNLLDFRIPDNAGRQPADAPVVAGGPAAYFSTLPVVEIAEAIRQAGVPAELSLSAGSYLCNQLAYVALHTAARLQPAPRCGFLHVPSLPEQAALQPRQMPSMARESVCQGLAAALGVLRATRGA